MKDSVRYFRFINSQTGYVISYYSADAGIDCTVLKENLEKERNKLAVERQVYVGTIYWQEVKEDND